MKYKLTDILIEKLVDVLNEEDKYGYEPIEFMERLGPSPYNSNVYQRVLFRKINTANTDDITASDNKGIKHGKAKK